MKEHDTMKKEKYLIPVRVSNLEKKNIPLTAFGIESSVSPTEPITDTNRTQEGNSS